VRLWSIFNPATLVFGAQDYQLSDCRMEFQIADHDGAMQMEQMKANRKPLSCA
jgi:hypothetical protein